MDTINNLFDKVYAAGLTAADLYTLTNLERTKAEYDARFCVSVACDKLHKEGWLDNDNNHTEKAKEFLGSLSELFKPLKKKKQVIEVDKAMVTKYNGLFPAIKLPTGLYAKCNEKELAKAFEWFFKEYGNAYSWDVILRATEKYLREREEDKWMYCRTSKYLIRKMLNDKSWTSDLASMCDAIKGNFAEEQEEQSFTQKVV
jgi:hypothetical protein